MPESMTGYGEATLENDSLYLHTTIKSLNSKYLDIQFNLPKNLIHQEQIWRKLFSEKLQRGHITLEVTYVSKQTPIDHLVDETLVKNCYQKLKDIAKELDANTNLLDTAIHITQKKTLSLPEPFSKKQLLDIHKTIQKALTNCIINRQREGYELQEQIIYCLENLKHQLEQINQHTPKRNQALRAKLNEKLALRENIGGIDPHRWEQETLYYLEKMDIEEEKIRLQSHMSYFHQTLQKKESIGKKLNFIAQEIGRELNTIASKAQDFVLQHIVINMKQNLEQIKEQLQNLV